MLFFLISFLSFLLLFTRSASIHPLPSWASETRLLPLLCCKELLHLFSQCLRTSRILVTSLLAIPAKMPVRNKAAAQNLDTEAETEMSVLDLPELALECILRRLPPAGLCSMASVCSSLKDRCRSDYFWERHMEEKWGRVIGKTARKEWLWYVASGRDLLDHGKPQGWVGSLTCMWPISWIRSKLDSGRKVDRTLPADSIMSWYLALESGKFWFPAQVYNRENGHVGFMLSCYDAEISYDWPTDTFRARYPPHGRRTIVIEDGIQWERVRAPPVDTRAHDLHVSACLKDLRPGDHIEIQWRRNKEFPYGWWYGIVGHLESCDGNELHCRCHKSDTLVLEFNQYAPGSRWRRATLDRKDHREEGNETDGFYGGIRKLHSKDEVSMWRQLWPSETLE